MSTIKRITFSHNTKLSQFYVIIKNVTENINLALTDALASQLNISIDKIKRDFPVVEIDSEGIETAIPDPTLSQIIQTINPAQLTEIFHKDGEEFLVIRTPIKTRDESGESTFDQVKALVRAQRTGETVAWTGDVYTHSDYEELLEEIGGWDNITQS